MINDKNMTFDQSSDAEVSGVLAGLVSHLDADAVEAIRPIAQTAAVRKAIECARIGDYQGYRFALSYPLQKVMHGLLGVAIPGKVEAQFILTYQDFLKAHFQEIITRYEGMSCCADKTGAILRRLLRYYLFGEEIVFDKNVNQRAKVNRCR